MHEARRAITNEQLNRYNRIASSLFETPSGRAAHPGIFPVRSFAAVGSQLTHTMYDGLHHGEDAKQHVSRAYTCTESFSYLMSFIFGGDVQW